MADPDPNQLGPPTRHRADDDVEALASGSFAPVRTPNGAEDLLDDKAKSEAEVTAAAESLSSQQDSSGEKRTRSVSFSKTTPKGPVDPDGKGEREPSSKSASVPNAQYDKKPSGGWSEQEHRLSLKTNQIMSDYRAYLEEIDTEIPMEDGGKSMEEKDQADKYIEEVRGAYRDTYLDYHQEKTFPMPSPEDGYGGHGGDAGLGEQNAGISINDGLLKRGWAQKDDTLSEVPFGNNNYDDIREQLDLTRDKRYQNSVQILHSKRIKRGLLAIVTACAALVTIGALASYVDKSRKSNQLPDWEKELEEVKKEVEVKKQSAAEESSEEKNQKVAEPDPSPALSDEIHRPPSQPDETDGDKSTAEKAENENTAHEEELKYKALSLAFEPIWYDRTMDWEGTSYHEAIVFCASKESRVPCEYTVYCPDGEGNPPLGGFKNEPRGTWAPFMSSKSGWVQVSEKGSCVINSDPDFGIIGVPDEEVTRHIMCCLEEPSSEAGPSEGEQYDKGGENSQAEQATNKENVPSGNSSANDEAVESAAVAPEAAAAATESPNESTTSTEHEPSDTPNEPSDTPAETSDAAPAVFSTESTNDEPDNLPAQAQYLIDKANPEWYGRKDGYEGTSHDHANDFCNSKGGRTLCPLGVYCPNGPTTDGSPPLFFEMHAFTSEQWAPVFGSNTWVQIGKVNDDATTTCSTFFQLNGEPPSWGTVGNLKKLKKHILCCEDGFTADHSIASSGAGPVSDIAPPPQTENAPNTDNAGGTPQETMQESQPASNKEHHVDMEKVIASSLEPLWLGSYEGWNGGSHNDAIEFCKGVRGKQLCPYGAYCPNGKGKPVMGRHHTDFLTEGEQYAPVMGAPNRWVMIGRKQGNKATTCMTHEELEGTSPAWGLTSDNAELKKHIMCCTIN